MHCCTLCIAVYGSKDRITYNAINLFHPGHKRFHPVHTDYKLPPRISPRTNIDVLPAHMSCVELKLEINKQGSGRKGYFSQVVFIQIIAMPAQLSPKICSILSKNSSFTTPFAISTMSNLTRCINAFQIFSINCNNGLLYLMK